MQSVEIYAFYLATLSLSLMSPASSLSAAPGTCSLSTRTNPEAEAAEEELPPFLVGDDDDVDGEEEEDDDEGGEEGPSCS